jgi:hypothetical protein
MSARTSVRLRFVVPTGPDSWNVYPGQRHGTTSKILLLVVVATVVLAVAVV